MKSGPIRAADMVLTPLNGFLPDIIISILEPKQMFHLFKCHSVFFRMSLSLLLRQKKVTKTQIYLMTSFFRLTYFKYDIKCDTCICHELQAGLITTVFLNRKPFKNCLHFKMWFEWICVLLIVNR